jgi:hypothetical protein
LLDEIRNLRIELHEERLERVSGAVAALQRSIQGVQAERTAVGEELRSHQEEFARWRAELLHATEYPVNERSRMESAKTAMTSEAVRELDQRAAALAYREAALVQTLSYELERLRSLQEKLAALRQAR